jgi:hypothetical protein
MSNFTNKIIYIYKDEPYHQVLVVHGCKPSYSGG